MKINHIELTNYRKFKSFKASFEDNLTVIVGDNGTGKSSLLDAAAVAIGSLFAGLDGVPATGISKSDVRNICYDMGSVIDLQPQFPVMIKVSGTVDGHCISWTRSLNSSEGRTTTVDAKEIIAVAQMYQERVRAGDKTAILPILSYYGTGRLWAQKKEKRTNEGVQSFSRYDGYTDCLAAESNEKLMLKWFEKMTIQEAQRKAVSPEFSAVRQAICKCFEGITGFQNTDAQFNLDTHGIDIIFTDEHHTHSRQPMQNLSDGYRNTLGMIADIAYRMAVLNPALLGDVLEKTPGVVLIDEVDLHLHPLWQQRILGDLTSIFPQVQFIVSTHAPSVISSVKSKNLLILSGAEDGYSPASESYGLSANSVLTGIMEAYDRPVRVKEKFEQFYRAIDAGRLAESEGLLTELEQLLGVSDPELTSARVTLDLEKM